MNRRNFLKTTALASGGTALIFSNVLGKSVKLSYHGSMSSASYWGTYSAVVKDGRLIGLRYPYFSRAKDASIGLIERVYVDRVKYPLVRKSFLKDGHKSDTSLRGKEEFVRVSWDKATELIASEIKRVQKKREGKNIFAGFNDWWSVGSLTSAPGTMKRLLNLTGGFIDHIGDYSTGASQVINPYVTGSIEVYDQQTDWDLVIKHADNIIYWGCDVHKSSQIDFAVADNTAYYALKKLIRESKRRKINHVFIDPAVNSTQKKFAHNKVHHVTHMAPNPNTDLTIMFAIAHYLYTNKKYDSAFVETYTVGFEKFIAYIMGKTMDKVVKDAKWASKISGVSSEEIINLAKLLSHGKTMIMSGWSMQRADHGEQPSWMIILLAAMLGQIGKAGTGFGFSYHYSGGGSHNYKFPGLQSIASTPALGKNGAKMKESVKGYQEEVPVVKLSEMLLNPGDVIKYNGKKVKYQHIDMLYVSGGSPFNHQMNTNHFYKGWNNVETVVVHDIYMSTSAKMADIILPICSEFEKNDIASVGSYSGSQIVSLKQVIKPIGESKNDYAACLEVAKKLGVEKEFSEGRSEMEWLEYFYANSAKAAKGQGVHMPSFKYFWRKGYVAFPRERKEFIRYADFIKDPEENPLGTESGLIHFYSPTIDKYDYKECKGHPVWMEPAEYIGNRKNDKYLHLITPHPLYRLHSQLNNSKSLRAKYEMHDREPFYMNSKDAKRFGISHGDLVKVSNDRGSVIVYANLHERVKENVAMLHEGAWLDPIFDDDKISCNHGLANVTTLDKTTSELAQANSVNSNLVKVEKYSGKVRPVKLFKDRV